MHNSGWLAEAQLVAYLEKNMKARQTFNYISDNTYKLMLTGALYGEEYDAYLFDLNREFYRFDRDDWRREIVFRFQQYVSVRKARYEMRKQVYVEFLVSAGYTRFKATALAMRTFKK